MADEKSIIKEFIAGGWIVSVVGGLGMAARLMIEDKRMPIMDYVRKILAAIICSTIAWFVLEQMVVSSFIKAITYGIVGVTSPELIAAVVKLVKRIGKKPDDYIKS